MANHGPCYGLSRELERKVLFDYLIIINQFMSVYVNNNFYYFKEPSTFQFGRSFRSSSMDRGYDWNTS